ncbi:hypothetical protein DM01DRAFT_1409796 [Hesseltinella vesiculosa]|uniref:Reticulon-like protein n=1 Tax=Hesseltinella vesiculosa TaxID=101127 RepID=A0A1X2G9I9_9FUNG|nr:hypothetical protein DM01DRAFT_1409796 [Hesseltinella vesiculosa]
MNKADILDVLLWKQPMHSGLVFSSLLLLILIGKTYSFVSLISSMLALATGINLVYVTFTKRLAGPTAAHPYQAIFDSMHTETKTEKPHPLVTRACDVAQDILLELKSVVLVENSQKTLSWFFISYITWRMSSVFSSHTLLLVGLFSTFTLPLAYYMNQDVLEAKRHQILKCADQQWARVKERAVETLHAQQRRSATSQLQ